MRNVFDQYQHPENRLTHALVCTLSNDRKLLRSFLRWLNIEDVPSVADLRLVEQQVPGVPVSGDEDESDGLPDACIYDESGEWAVLFEAKVQAKVKSGQLRRHLATASRRGYPDARLVVLTVDQPRSALPDRVHAVQWWDIYAWFSTHGSKGGKTEWPAILTDYMQKFETKMIAQNHAIRGTITTFDGLRFDRENPYTYREAKRLLRLLGDELQKRKDLERLDVDPDAERRQAITGRHGQIVWDYLPLKIARGQDFTKHPHLTIANPARRR